ncbi:hypothetical protein [Sphingomonas phage Birtae]|nr:hypothetical protein [Sphingomonas phage Birtae]
MSVLLSLIPASRPGAAGEAIPAGWTDGTPITISQPPQGANVGTFGAVASPSATALPAASSAAPLRSFMDLFYFRIWAIPNVLDAQNPRINTPIPFKIWNAYLEANELQGINAINAEGLTLDIAAGEVFDALELKTVNANIGPEAPYQIDANFEFDFADGGTVLRFLAQLADILPVQPEYGIVEKLEWLTDILPSYDGTDQRIALRNSPRISYQLPIVLEDDAARKELYDKLYKTATLTVIAPSYQYQTRLKKNAVIGDNKVYCNPKRADLRQGDNVIILDKRTGLFFLYKVANVFEDHVTIATAFAQTIKAGAIVAGGFAGRFPNMTGLAMNSVSGNANITINMIDVRHPLAYPDNGVVLPTMKGYPVLDRRALADNEAGEQFDAGVEVIDNQTGKPQFYSAWPLRYVEGVRRFAIQRLYEPDEIEHWRTFFDYCRGRQRAFFLSTFRQDLVKVEGSEALATKVEVEGNEYATQYFVSPIYRQLEIETDRGTFRVSVSNVTNNGSSTTINFEAPIEADMTDIVIYRISYLMLVRLASDTVTLTHEATRTIVELNIRTTAE